MQQAGNAHNENEDIKDATINLHLYITGASPNSIRAVENVKRICEQYFKGKYELEIVDVYQQPLIVLKEQLVALPMLIKSFPLPIKKWIGDMCDENKLIAGLSE
jgi:circadian clock protein KaiB